MGTARLPRALLPAVFLIATAPAQLPWREDFDGGAGTGPPGWSRVGQGDWVSAFSHFIRNDQCSLLPSIS